MKQTNGNTEEVTLVKSERLPIEQTKSFVIDLSSWQQSQLPSTLKIQEVTFLHQNILFLISKISNSKSTLTYWTLLMTFYSS